MTTYLKVAKKLPPREEKKLFAAMGYAMIKPNSHSCSKCGSKSDGKIKTKK